MFEFPGLMRRKFSTKKSGDQLNSGAAVEKVQRSVQLKQKGKRKRKTNVFTIRVTTLLWILNLMEVVLVELPNKTSEI